MAAISVIVGIDNLAGVNLIPTDAQGIRPLVRLVLGPGIGSTYTRIGPTGFLTLSVDALAGGQPWFSFLSNADPTVDAGVSPHRLPSTGFLRLASDGSTQHALVWRAIYSGSAYDATIDVDASLNMLFDNHTLNAYQVHWLGAGGVWEVKIDSTVGFVVQGTAYGIRVVVQSANFAVVPQTLTYASTVALDFDASATAKLTLAGNVTIAAPSNVLDGGRYVVRITRGSGGESFAWNAVFKFGASWTAAPDAGAAAVTAYVFEGEAGGVMRCVGRS